jgi:hypothetical protein
MLSDADANTLCMDAANSAALKSADALSCGISGLLAALLSSEQTDAGLQAACQTAFDECSTSAGMATVMCDSKPSSACTATVGEYEKCLNDDVAQIQTLSAQIPMCKDLTAAKLDASTAAIEEQMEPASCTVVDMKCPEASPSSM